MLLSLASFSTRLSDEWKEKIVTFRRQRTLYDQPCAHMVATVISLLQTAVNVEEVVVGSEIMMKKNVGCRNTSNVSFSVYLVSHKRKERKINFRRLVGMEKYTGSTSRFITGIKGTHMSMQNHTSSFRYFNFAWKQNHSWLNVQQWCLSLVHICSVNRERSITV